jgi:hypothetical protein
MSSPRSRWRIPSGAERFCRRRLIAWGFLEWGLGCGQRNAITGHGSRRTCSALASLRLDPGQGARRLLGGPYGFETLRGTHRCFPSAHPS